MANKRDDNLRALATEIVLQISARSEKDSTFPSYYLKKDTWTTLGNFIKEAEKPETSRIIGKKWITLRLDGNGFSKLIPRLRRAGVLRKEGFSPKFGDIMKSCCQELMKKFNASCGYTQSDEVTILIPCASIVRGEQMEHSYKGRVMKICSVAASFCTAVFNRGIAEILRKRREGGKAQDTILSIDCWPTFDCRIGQYGTFVEAFSLIMWRAYDCGINGVSDAVHQLKNEGLVGQEEVSRKSTSAKLKWLEANGKLPLPLHQSQGSLFCKVFRMKSWGIDPRTGKEAPPTRRRIIEQIDGHVLRLVRDGKIEGLTSDDSKMPMEKATRNPEHFTKEEEDAEGYPGVT